MKTLILAMTVLFAFNAQAYKTADQSSLTYAAQFIEMEINHEGLNNVDGGYIQIDHTHQEITLTLHRAWSCPEGAACVMVMPAPVIIKLPIVNQYADWCGSTTYEAEVDNTPVDGLLQSIKVTDYSTLMCRIHMPFMTSVVYQTFNPWTQDTVVSTFNGEILTLQPTLF